MNCAPHGGWLPSPDPLLKAPLDLWSSRALAAGQHLGVFAELGKGPRTAGRLADALGLTPEAARDLLDALLVLGWLMREGDDAQAVYVSTREGAHFLDPRSPGYLGDLLLAARAPWTGPQDAALDDALRAGSAPGADAAWTAARRLMRQRLGSLHGETLAQQFPPRPGAGAVLDLHGDGARLACAWAAQAGREQAVTSLQPPAEVLGARAHVQACGLAPRVRVVSMERAGASPADAAWPAPIGPHDTAVLSLLLEPGGAERRRARLHQAVALMVPGGRLLVVEHLADDARRLHVPALVFGLAGRMTGLERGAVTEGELRQDCRTCGLRDDECLPLPGGAGVLLAQLAP